MCILRGQQILLAVEAVASSLPNCKIFDSGQFRQCHPCADCDGLDDLAQEAQQRGRVRRDLVPSLSEFDRSFFPRCGRHLQWQRSELEADRAFVRELIVEEDMLITPPQYRYTVVRGEYYPASSNPRCPLKSAGRTARLDGVLAGDTLRAGRHTERELVPLNLEYSRSPCRKAFLSTRPNRIISNGRRPTDKRLSARFPERLQDDFESKKHLDRQHTVFRPQLPPANQVLTPPLAF